MAQLSIMAFDFTEIDGELDALGESTEQFAELAQQNALSFSSLADVDAALDALGTAQPVDFSAAQVNLPTRANPKSGEISLGEPVRRSVHPKSGKLAIDGEAPTSGSFELEEAEAPAEEFDTPIEASGEAVIHVLSVAPSARPAATAPEQPESEPPEPELPEPELPEPELPESEPPLSLFADNENELISDTPPEALKISNGHVSVSESSQSSDPFASVVDEFREPEAVPGLFNERDPDAEFDALFDEATSPSGVPSRGFDEDGASLLRSLRAPAVPSTTVGAGENEAASALSALFEMEEGDATEILDARSVFSEQNARSDPFPSDEELGSSEFEIVLDETGEAKDLVPSERPPKPPTPVPPSTPDKRPSFLGRLFGRKDD